MNLGTAVLILLLLFAIRFMIPFSVIMLIRWYNDQVAVNAA